MAYFDVRGYPGEKSPLDLTTGLSSVGDALTDVLSRRQKAQQFQQQLEFEREDAARKLQQNAANDAYQNRIIDQREHRDELTFNQQQAERQQRATEAAAKAMSEGNPEMAKAILHSTVSYDPATGQETGRGELVPGQMRDVGPAPQQPQAPPPAQPVPPEIAARRRGRTNVSEDEAANFYQSEGRPMPPQTGVDPLHPEPPVITDDGRPPSPTLMRDYDPSVQSARYQDTSDALAEQQARLDAQGHDQAQSAFESASAAYPQARAEYEARLRAAQGEQPFTIRFGANDPGVQISPEALRYGRRHAAADDFATSIRGLNLDDRGKGNAAAALAMLEAGRDPQAVYAAFDRAQATGQRFEDTTALQTQKDKAALERTNVAAASPKDQFYRERALEGYAAGNRQDRAELRQELDDWEKNTAGVQKDAAVWKRLRMSLSNIRADNPVAQQDALLGLASVFRGGNAATKDVTTAVRSHLGGAEATAEGWMEQAATGKLGPEQQRTALAAVRNAVKEHDEQIKEHYRSFVKRFGPGHGLEDQATTINGFMDSILEEHGLAAPPVYETADPTSGAMGSTSRPYRKPPPRRGPPEVGARQRGKAASDLDAAMQ